MIDWSPCYALAFSQLRYNMLWNPSTAYDRSAFKAGHHICLRDGHWNATGSVGTLRSMEGRWNKFIRRFSGKSRVDDFKDCQAPTPSRLSAVNLSTVINFSSSRFPPTSTLPFSLKPQCFPVRTLWPCSLQERFFDGNDGLKLISGGRSAGKGNG
jgi:hypothetical protein